MKKISTFLFLMIAVVFAWGQEAQFTAVLSIDSLLMGNRTKVTFTLENGRGSNFTAPDFPGFTIVGGPSQSSTYSMINGLVTQSQSYTYFLEPLEIGNYYIQPASIKTAQEVLETAPLSITVLPNPDAVQQKATPENKSFDLFKTWPSEAPKLKKPRKKRRIYRI